MLQDNKYNQEWLEAEKKQEENNKIILDMVQSKVSEEAYQEILNELDEYDWIFDYQITDKPLGKMRDLDEYEFIDGVYVNQTTDGGYTGDEFAGTCSIKISENEYFQFNYSM